MIIYGIYRNDVSYDWLERYKSDGHEIALLSSDEVYDFAYDIDIKVGNLYRILSNIDQKVILTDKYYDIQKNDHDNVILANKILDCDRKLFVNPFVNINTQVYFHDYFQSTDLYDISTIVAPKMFWEQVARVHAKWTVYDFIENKQFFHELICNFVIKFYKYQVKFLES